MSLTGRLNPVPFGLEAWRAPEPVKMRQLAEKSPLSSKSNVHYMMVLVVRGHW